MVGTNTLFCISSAVEQLQQENFLDRLPDADGDRSNRTPASVCCFNSFKRLMPRVFLSLEMIIREFVRPIQGVVVGCGAKPNFLHSKMSTSGCLLLIALDSD